MKILFVLHSLELWWWLQKIISQIWNEFFHRWYDISYFTFYNSKNNEKVNWNIFCKNEKISNNFFYNSFKLFSRSFFINNIYKKIKPDVIITSADQINFSTLILKFIYWKNIKIITTVHQDLSIYKRWSYSYLLIKLLYNKSDKIVVVSDWLKDFLLKEYNISNVITIYNFFDEKKTLIKNNWFFW
jgi:hypothetical protein